MLGGVSSFQQLQGFPTASKLGLVIAITRTA
jgi:hypothetical protein